MSLSAFGDVVVVTTSERRMVGYSDTGVRLWELRSMSLHRPRRSGCPTPTPCSSI